MFPRTHQPLKILQLGSDPVPGLEGHSVTQESAEGELYDLVAGGDGLARMENPRAALEASLQHLKPRGQVFLSFTPFLWTRRSLRNLLEGAGLWVGRLKRSGGRLEARASVPHRRTRTPLDAQHLTVAMITMNEEKAVGKVIDDIRAVVPEAEILIVDSSKDQTAEIAEAKGCRVIKQFPPKGYGRAMDLALRSAGGEVVVTLDCDDTYPTPDIPRLARLVLDEGYDLVDGSRLEDKPAAMPWLNYLANFGFATLASFCLGRWLTDLHSGMRAYHRDVIARLHYDPPGAALPVELLIRPIREGRRVVSVFIDYRERIGTSTLRPLESAWWTWVRIRRAVWG